MTVEFSDALTAELAELDSEAMDLAGLLPPGASWNEIRLEALLRAVASIRIRLRAIECDTRARRAGDAG